MGRSDELASQVGEQPPLGELLARYLSRNEEFPHVPGEVEPHHAPAVVELGLTWNVACAVLPLAGDNKGFARPEAWEGLVESGSNESQPAVAMAAGNYPQLFRSLSDLPQALRLRDLVGNVGTSTPYPGLEEWADKTAQKSLAGRLLAAGVLRLARNFTRAEAILGGAGNLAPEAKCAWINERGALAWHCGDLEEGLRLWSSDPTTAAAQFNRGMALLFLDRPAEALKPLDAAVSNLAEDDPWRHLAGIYQVLAEMRAQS